MRTNLPCLYIPSEEMEPRSFEQVRRWQEIAATLLRKYCDRFYKVSWWSGGITKKHFQERSVLFMREEKATYIAKMLAMTVA